MEKMEKEITQIDSAVREARKRKRLTVKQLAQMVGTDQGNLSRIELGQQDASPDLARAIAAELGLTMDDVYGIAVNG